MRYLLLVLALAIPSMALAQATGPVATLDRSTVGVGETVTLNIEVGDESTDEPDLSPLQNDFTILGTSTNHSLSIINGRREAHTILGVALRPRREGHLTIPGIAVGTQRTQPVSLEVAASSDTSATAGDRPVVLEGKAEPAQAYVGQQIDYTLRLYFAVNLADGQLGDPSAEGAEVRRIGQDANYQNVRGGRRFNVIERHYAIFPQRAGSLEIQPPTFQGTAVDPTDAGSFFGAGAPVSAVAERLHITVRERPSSSAPDAAWIPARELKLGLEGLPTDGKGRVGQPITLTMRLDAVGMPFEALPALSLPKIDGADVYPDKAVTGGGTSGSWVTGRRQQGFAVVPTRTGTLHIPETTLHWWNVVTDKAEVATVPAHDIEIAAGTGAPAPGAGIPVTPASATPSTPGVAAPAFAVSSTPWRWLFLAALVLWVVTVAAWLLFGRRRPKSAVASASHEPVRERPAREAFLASTSGDAATADRLLLAWAQTIRPSLRSTGALAEALASGDQRDAIAMLQRARFASGAVDGAALKAAFTRGFDWSGRPSGDGPSGLPPLYPG
jgi:hypothetical protein